MPITADRMLKLIDLAEQTMEKSENAGRILKGVYNDISQVQQRFNELRINDEVLDELIFNITRATYDGQLMCITPAQQAQELGEEKKNFWVNQGKHKNAAARMRILREGHRTLKFKARKSNHDSSSDLSLDTMVQQELDDRQRIGQERHPDQGPCNGDGADGQCTWCQEREKWEEDDEDHQHEQWLPKTKPETPVD